jgi:hypothetical protein
VARRAVTLTPMMNFVTFCSVAAVSCDFPYSMGQDCNVFLSIIGNVASIPSGLRAFDTIKLFGRI